MSRGILVVLSGPSGCGKGTITKELKKDPQIFVSISATTRSPRDGEQDGEDYRFLSKEEFTDRLNNGGMLEYNEYCGHFYGTPRKEMQQNLDDGRDVILEIDVNGGKQVCKKADITIFILPPSMEELRHRLSSRGTEPPEVVEQRLKEAVREIHQAYSYDYVVVNDVLEDAVAEIQAILTAEKHKEKNMEDTIKGVLES